MLTAVIWGVIQGLTEFLPVSSSGHLVIIPAFLNELGFDVALGELHGQVERSCAGIQHDGPGFRRAPLRLNLGTGSAL